MKSEDDELKDILNPLSSLEPSELQLTKWKKAINKEKQASRISFSIIGWMAQLLAATLFGVAISSLIFKKTEPTQSLNNFQTVSYHDVTFERSHAKLD